jgi:hypothetical protein
MRGTSTNGCTAAGAHARAARRQSYSWCAATPASNAKALALNPDAAQRVSSRVRLSCGTNCCPRTTTNALLSFIRRTLHGARFAAYAVAACSLTLEPPRPNRQNYHTPQKTELTDAPENRI